MEGFEVERIVGEGSYGKAILAKCKKDNKKVIIKVTSSSSSSCYAYVIFMMTTISKST